MSRMQTHPGPYYDTYARSQGMEVIPPESDGKFRLMGGRYTPPMPVPPKGILARQ